MYRGTITVIHKYFQERNPISVMTRKDDALLLKSTIEMYNDTALEWYLLAFTEKDDKTLSKSSETSSSLSFSYEDNMSEEQKVDASMADHLIARGWTHSRKTQHHHLMEVVVPPRWGVFLATRSSRENFSHPVGTTSGLYSMHFPVHQEPIWNMRLGPPHCG